MVRLTDRPDMTLDVYRGRKTTMQQVPLLAKGLITKYCHFKEAYHRFESGHDLAVSSCVADSSFCPVCLSGRPLTTMQNSVEGCVGQTQVDSSKLLSEVRRTMKESKRVHLFIYFLFFFFFFFLFCFQINVYVL